MTNLQVKVSQFEAKNQFTIQALDCLIFQSYKSTICKIYPDLIVVDPKYCFYSRTTSKYFNLFIWSDKKEAIKKHLKKFWYDRHNIPELVVNGSDPITFADLN